MKKRLFALALALCMLCLGAFGAAASETETTAQSNTPREPGYCGENITWNLSDGTLTVSGSGEMDDFPEGAPWVDSLSEIKKVTITGGITYIGAYAFKDCDNLVEVDFGDSVYEIGTEAFRSCDGLVSITLPASFKIFGESCFQSCSNLKEIHCEGKFPSFRQNCLWEVYATIYYPAERAWSVTYIAQLETAFKGRIEFRASDGTDPYTPTEAATEPPATEEATEPSVTAAPTELPTTAYTQAVVQETSPETTESPETVPETTVPAPSDASGGSNGILIGALIVFVVAVLLLIGAIAVRAGNRSSRGRRRRRN